MLILLTVWFYSSAHARTCMMNEIYCSELQMLPAVWPWTALITCRSMHVCIHVRTLHALRDSVVRLTLVKLTRPLGGEVNSLNGEGASLPVCGDTRCFPL